MSLTVSAPGDILQQYIKAVDECFEEYKLPKYYEVFIKVKTFLEFYFISRHKCLVHIDWLKSDKNIFICAIIPLRQIPCFVIIKEITTAVF